MISLRQGRIDRNAAVMANAWHFGSDFAGTMAVLVGLGLVAAGVPAGDSLAAIFVAAIVLLGALRLARQNIDALMDRTPWGGPAGRRARAGAKGVSEVRSVRVREAGGESFAEVVIGVPRLAGVERSHETTDMVEGAVRDSLGRAQVTVHVEPAAADETLDNDRVAAAALRVPGRGRGPQHLGARRRVRRAVTLHVRLPEDETLRSAWDVVERLKDEIRREVGIARVYAHVEPSAPGAQPARDIGARSRRFTAWPPGPSARWRVRRSSSWSPGRAPAARRDVDAGRWGALGGRGAHAGKPGRGPMRDAIAAVDDVIVEVC